MYVGFSDRIRMIRKAKGITQKELAETTKLPLMAIRRYESGEKELRVDDAYKIANALDVPFQDLITHQTISFNSTNQSANNVENQREKTDALLHLCKALKYATAKIDEYMVNVIGKSIEEVQEIKTSDLFFLIDCFGLLNEEGAAEAIKRVEELTQIPKYQKKPGE